MRLLVTGCGRSGTKWLAHSLTVAGVPTGHEDAFSVARHGEGDWTSEVSWLAAPYTPMRGTHVVHLVRHPIPRSADPVIIGFREQVSVITPGIQALIRRAMTEGTDLIVEGAHVVPGFINHTEFPDAVVVPLIITADDVEVHRAHFMMRAHETRSRPSDRYLDFFDNIRKIQRYVKSLALERGVPLVPSYNLDSTLSQVIELVVSRAMEALPKNGSRRKPNS